jgi:hypothetical protein
MLDHGFNLRRIAHIGAVVVHLRAQHGHFGDLGLGAVHIAKAIENDVGTLGSQRLGNAQTNTTG